MLGILIGASIGYGLWHDHQIVKNHVPYIPAPYVAPKVAKINLTVEQEKYLKIAYKEGLAVGFAEEVQALVCIESRAGEYGKHKYGIVSKHDRNKSFGRQSYGPTQFQLKTARSVIRDHPSLGFFPTDEHLLVALMTDMEFAIKITAVHYADLARKYGKFNGFLAYNKGPAGMKNGKDPMRYISQAKRYMATIVKPFNKGEYSVDKGPSSLN